MPSVAKQAREILEECYHEMACGPTGRLPGVSLLLNQTGCLWLPARLVLYLATPLRTPTQADGLWLKARELKKYLAIFPQENVSAGDWPINWVDADSRRYGLGYLASHRHQCYLAIVHLLGGEVPTDLKRQFALSHLTSRCRWYAQCGDFGSRYGVLGTINFDC